MTSVGRKMVKSVRWSALEKAGQQGITFIVFAVLARFVAPEDFGLVAMALIITGFLQIFIDQGFSTAIIQQENLDDDFLSTAFWTNIGIGVVLSAVLIALKGLPAWLFEEPRVAELIPWMALALLIEAFMSVPQALLKRHFDFRGLALRTLVARVVAGIVAIFGAASGWGVWSLVVFAVMSNGLAMIILWWICDWKPRFHFSARAFSTLLTFGSNVTGVRLLGYLNSRVLDVLIGYFFGAAALGYYTLAFQLVGRIAAVIVQVLSQVTMSGFSRVQATRDVMLKHLLRVTRATTVLVFPLFALLGLLSHEVVNLIYGQGWEMSALMISILAPLGPCRIMVSALGDSVVSAGKPGLVLRARVVATTIVFVSLYAVLGFGLLPLVLVYSLSFWIIVLPLYFLIAQRVMAIRISAYLKQVAPAFIGTLGLLLAAELVNNFIPGLDTDLLRIVATSVASAVVYFLVLKMIGNDVFIDLRRVLVHGS